jgi:hypothetical protein
MPKESIPTKNRDRPYRSMSGNINQKNPLYMICILKINPATPLFDSIDSWIIATDTHDARRQVQSSGEQELASFFYQNEFLPRGKHIVLNKFVLLVD